MQFDILTYVYSSERTKTNLFFRGSTGAEDSYWKSLLPSQGGILGYLLLLILRIGWLFLLFLRTEASVTMGIISNAPHER